ncbi:MAG TPA: enolase C-terminal domain-like protein [Vicinamibacterales bacterium]|nr:enolase C-terminal domain-like protein [Vicinamibacterales bacterium]
MSGTFAHRARIDAAVDTVDVAAYTIPTDAPEADGTLDWHQTTIVIVAIEGGGRRGLGYSYVDASAATLIHGLLAGVVRGRSAMDVPAAWTAMVRAIRNVGRSGVASCAIAAVDAALWDLKSRLLDVPLASLLGASREGVEIYGSGGFTSYSIARLQEQLAAWVASGITRVKMKIGRDAHADVDRVQAAREAIGPTAELFVDANGAYDRKQALAVAEQIEPFGVTWFEEPVSSDDLEGLRLLRDRAPATIEIAAGEYGYDLRYFQRMLEAGAIDVLQATRRAARASRASFRLARSPTRSESRCRRTPRRRSTSRRAARSAASGTSSISMITFESSRCFSTGHRSPAQTDASIQICPGLGLASS